MKHLLAALLFLVSFGTAQASEPPACQGVNLLDDLLARDPAAHAAVMAEAALIPNGEAILWKIERDGTRPSHLVGTAHVTDPRIVKGPEGLEDLIANASVVALELAESGDQQAMAAEALRHAALMVMPPGQTLWDVIPDEHEEMIRTSPALPPGTVGSLYGYQPWVVAAMLSMPACEQAREASGLRVFDDHIALFANRKGVSVTGLETVEEQFKVLSGMPMDLQVEFLVESARMSGEAEDNFETLIVLYQRRQITAMLPLSVVLQPPSEKSNAALAYIQADLIDKRNRTMAERAAELLARGNAVIAVGALHLPGEQGLVALIRRAGYKVTPVN